jgi:hypothetical protein
MADDTYTQRVRQHLGDILVERRQAQGLTQADVSDVHAGDRP